MQFRERNIMCRAAAGCGGLHIMMGVCVGQERIEERRGEEYENDLFTSNGQNANR